MADASIIDIGGTQWNVKDKEARERVTTLEEKTSANFEYSENEKEIGTWIDGKKLYRLIIKGQTTNRNVTVDLSDKNIAELTKINGVINAEGTFFIPLPSYLARTTNEIANIYAYVLYNIGSKIISASFGKNSYYSSVGVTLQLEYTKNE